ncbi:MAG: transketolase [Christensenella sp.]
MDILLKEHLQNFASSMRKNIITLAYHAGKKGAHIAPSLSIVDILAVLYGTIMHYDSANPFLPERDRFILSKGHGALGYYTALQQSDIITQQDLETFEQNDGLFPGQPSMNLAKGIEASSGSLGQGLSLGVGIALAGKKKGMDYRTFVLMGDGECNEGTIWESAISAAHFQLGNLIGIIDRNHMQSDGDSNSIMNLEPFSDKWSAFGWNVIEADGHSISSLYDAFLQIQQNQRPTVIIAHTTKGYGVSFMENNNEWHHNHITDTQYASAMKELEVLPCR